MPKDGQVIVEILKDMGISEWEPKVVTQLLEFVYGYVTNVAEDAKLVSSHAKKKIIDVDDVKLAVQMYNEQNYAAPPSRDVLLDMARSRNAHPLPTPKTSSGLRLPPDRFCLTACNYRLKPSMTKRPPMANRSAAPSYTVRQTTVMPRIQIQPSTGNIPTTFTMTVNPP